MQILTIKDIQNLVQKQGILSFFREFTAYLKQDFAAWDSFQKSARYAAYAPDGVLELMPICGKERFAFKYVNGHPNNPLQNKLSVVAIGMLCDVENGYPILLSEMTCLTALRTAATSALASSYLARAGSKKLAMIGCGAQSEFQVLAHHALFELSEVHYFDPDEKAMQRFARHLKAASGQLALIAAPDTETAIESADIIITATAAKKKAHILTAQQLKPGVHIAGIGGDSPGKTELDPLILETAKIVIEYFEQSAHEGEIQNLGNRAKDKVYAELWQIISGLKPGRTSDREITLFDSVGFALEDYSILRYMLDLSRKHAAGTALDLIPTLQDPKNLFGALMGEAA